MRQQRFIAQGTSGSTQITAGNFLQIQADQPHHAMLCEFQFRAQVRGAKIIGDLNDAFGKIFLQDLQPAGRNQFGGHTITQSFVKKRPPVESGQ